MSSLPPKPAVGQTIRCYNGPFTDDPSTERLSISELREYFDRYCCGLGIELTPTDKKTAYYRLLLLSCGFEVRLPHRGKREGASAEVDRVDIAIDKDGKVVICITEFKELRGHVATMTKALMKHVPGKITTFIELITQLSGLGAQVVSDKDYVPEIIQTLYWGIKFSHGAREEECIQPSLPSGHKFERDCVIDQLLTRFFVSLFHDARYLFNFSISGLSFDGVHLTRLYNRLVYETITKRYPNIPSGMEFRFQNNNTAAASEVAHFAARWAVAEYELSQGDVLSQTRTLYRLKPANAAHKERDQRTNCLDVALLLYAKGQDVEAFTSLVLEAIESLYHELRNDFKHFTSTFKNHALSIYSSVDRKMYRVVFDPNQAVRKKTKNFSEYSNLGSFAVRSNDPAGPSLSAADKKALYEAQRRYFVGDKNVLETLGLEVSDFRPEDKLVLTQSGVLIAPIAVLNDLLIRKTKPGLNMELKPSPSLSRQGDELCAATAAKYNVIVTQTPSGFPISSGEKGKARRRDCFNVRVNGGNVTPGGPPKHTHKSQPLLAYFGYQVGNTEPASCDQLQREVKALIERNGAQASAQVVTALGLALFSLINEFSRKIISGGASRHDLLEEKLFDLLHLCYGLFFRYGQQFKEQINKEPSIIRPSFWGWARAQDHAALKEIKKRLGENDPAPLVENILAVEDNSLQMKPLWAIKNKRLQAGPKHDTSVPFCRRTSYDCLEFGAWFSGDKLSPQQKAVMITDFQAMCSKLATGNSGLLTLAMKKLQFSNLTQWDQGRVVQSIMAIIASKLHLKHIVLDINNMHLHALRQLLPALLRVDSLKYIELGSSQRCDECVEIIKLLLTLIHKGIVIRFAPTKEPKSQHESFKGFLLDACGDVYGLPGTAIGLSWQEMSEQFDDEQRLSALSLCRNKSA